MEKEGKNNNILHRLARHNKLANVLSREELEVSLIVVDSDYLITMIFNRHALPVNKIAFLRLRSLMCLQGEIWYIGGLTFPTYEGDNRLTMNMISEEKQ